MTSDLLLQWLFPTVARYQQHCCSSKQNRAIHPVCSNQTNWFKRVEIKSIFTPENEAYFCTTIEVIPCTDIRALQCCVWYLHAMHRTKATFQLPSTGEWWKHTKRLEHLYALWGSTLFNIFHRTLDRWLQNKKRLQVATVSAGLFCEY